MLTADEVLGELSENWGWLLVAGIGLIIFGAIGLYMEVVVTVATVLYIGILTVAAGVLVTIGSFKAEGWKAKLWQLLVGVAYIVAGVVMWMEPEATATWVTLFISAALIAAGILRMVAGAQMRGTDGWILTIISGVAGIALGVLLFADWPLSGTYAIGMFVSIDMLMQGISLSSVAFAARRVGREDGGISAPA